MTTKTDVENAVRETVSETDAISGMMWNMRKDLSELRETIIASGNEELIWRYNRCVRRSERVGERADRVNRLMDDAEDFLRDERRGAMEAVE